MAVNVTDNLMGRLSPKWVESFKKMKSHENRVAWVRNYPIQNGEEEAIIQLLVDKLDPAVPSVTRVSQVREEMQKDEAKGNKSDHGLDTVEGETYWQNRLDVAQQMDEADRVADVRRRHADIKKLFPDLLPQEEEATIPLPKTPSISINPATKEAVITETKFDSPPSNAVSETQGNDLDTVPGFGKDTINKFMDSGIICQKQLFNLTYSQALLVAKTPLVLAKIKARFKSE